MTESELLFDRHAFASPVVDQWLSDNYANKTITARAMRGRFAESKLSNIYKYSFAPDPNGPHQAIVFPVEDVDIVAIRYGVNRKKLDVWGCVTGEGRFLSRTSIHDQTRTSPLAVHEHWSDFLRDPSGVLPLQVRALSDLCGCDVLVNSSSAAIRLLYEAYLLPLQCAANSDKWKAASVEGRRRIWINDPRNVE